MQRPRIFRIGVQVFRAEVLRVLQGLRQVPSVLNLLQFVPRELVDLVVVEVVQGRLGLHHG